MSVFAAIDFSGPHLAEFGPPLVASAVYLTLYGRRARTLARQGRPLPGWRVASFITGALLLAVVQVGPFDSLGDQMLVAHMIQHIIIGDFCSLLVVLGLTGPVLQPLLHVRATRPLRVLSHPLIALGVWALNLYAWHVPVLYQLAIRVDVVHALEHATLFWFGTALWLALVGPLPKPRWFAGWGQIGYVVVVRFAGAILANILIWTQSLLYPVYRSGDAARGLNPLSDQNVAGGLMMVEQIILTTLLLGWLFYQFAIRDEERQALLDLANERGVTLSDERAARAAAAGTAGRLRERLTAEEPQATIPRSRSASSTSSTAAPGSPGVNRTSGDSGTS